MRTKPILILTSIMLSILVWSCGRGQRDQQPDRDGFVHLIEYIEKHADFVNTQGVSGVIDIDVLLKMDAPHYLIIDIRPVSDFEAGHYPGAIHVLPENMPQYFEQTIDPAAFDTIVLISADGQEGMYVMTMMRLLGYPNVYSLRNGMGWHKDYAEQWWIRHLSSAYDSLMITGPSPADKQYPYPIIPTTLTGGYQLLRERVIALLQEGAYKEFTIKTAELFANPDSFFIINYWPENFYQVGHIPGARQYAPRKSLSRDTRLATLPPDKPIVLYCFQGSTSSSVIAYLQVLGYHAKSLFLGTNTIMYDRHREHIKQGIFIPEAVIDIPLDTKDKRATRGPAIEVVEAGGGC